MKIIHVEIVYCHGAKPSGQIDILDKFIQPTATEWRVLSVCAGRFDVDFTPRLFLRSVFLIDRQSFVRSW